MVKTIKLALVMLVALGVMSGVVPAFSQEEVAQPAVASISGEVVSADAMNSTLVIKQNDTADGTQTIMVLPETKITKGDAVLKLSDLKPGDMLMISQSVDAQGMVTTTAISVATK